MNSQHNNILEQSDSEISSGPSGCNNNGKTALYLAAENGFEGNDLDGTLPALHIAAQNGHEEIVKILINHGNSVDTRDNRNKTPLHRAAEFGRHKIVKFLLDRGASVNATCEFGTTALHLASKNGHKKVIRYLLNRGISANVKNDFGETALHAASQEGHAKIVKLLIKFRANVNDKDEDSKTSLYHAAEYGHPKIVKILLNCKANINEKTRIGKTALIAAIEEGDCKVVQLLLNFRADIIINCEETCTSPIHIAVESEFLTIACILVKHVVKMKSQLVYISEENLTVIENNFRLKRFQDKCKNEIENLKREILPETSISYYDLLTKSTIQVAMYANNKKIRQVLKSSDLRKIFPIYFDVILIQFKKGEARNSLLKECTKYCHFLFTDLSENCTKKIFDYLLDEDVKLMTSLCKLDKRHLRRNK